MSDMARGAGDATRRLLHLPPDVRELVDSMPDVFYRVDREDRLVVISRSALRFLGYDSDAEILGRPAAAFWAHRERRAAFLAALEERGELNDWEADLLRRDGTVVHVATTVRSMRDEQGAIIGYQGIWRDICERKRAEEALRQSEERFAKVFLTVPDTITISRLADGKIVAANPGFERATGWSRDEVLGRTTFELDLWADTRQREALVRVLGVRGEVIDGAITYHRRDGTLREGSYSARAIEIGGEPCVVFIMHDVTERRRDEAALRLQEQRLARAIEGADLATWEYIVPTGATAVNERFAKMLGWVPDGTVAWAERIHPEDAPAVTAALRAHLADESNGYEVENRLRHRDGHWVWVLSKGRVVERDADGRPYRMCGTHLDITPRKHLEEERAAVEAQLREAQKLEAIGQIAGGVAHDFNNLLTVQISSLQELAEAPELSGDSRELVAEVERAARAAADLTRQLLAFGRRQVLQSTRVDLNEAVAGFLKMLRRVLRENIRVAYAPAAPLWVDVDVGMLQQVLMNLALNAQDAMPDGGDLAIEVRAVDIPAPADAAHAERRPGPFARLSVADTGHGMDDATLRRAFDPFFTTKPSGRGSGLGLATVYGIVKQHGGFIDVETAPGRGARFHVHWPRGQDGAPRAIAAATSAAVPRGRGESVLLVEDEAVVRRALRATVQRLGYEVVEAADAEGALALLRGGDSRVDVLLSDVVMPGLSGVELARRVRGDRPGMPVVLMSGYSGELVAEGVPEGVLFLRKPIETAVLASTMRSAVEAAR